MCHNSQIYDDRSPEKILSFTICTRIMIYKGMFYKSKYSILAKK